MTLVKKYENQKRKITQKNGLVLELNRETH